MATYAGAYPSKPSWQLQLDASESSPDIVNNRSYVSWALYMYRGNSDTPFNNSASGWAVGGPGGTSGAFGAYRFGGSGTGTSYAGTPVGGRVLIASGGAWVTHAADGTGSASFSASHAAAATLGTASLSGTLTLTTIQRNLIRVKVAGSMDQHLVYAKINGVMVPVQPAVKDAGVMKLLNNA